MTQKLAFSKYLPMTGVMVPKLIVAAVAKKKKNKKKLVLRVLNVP